MGAVPSGYSMPHASRTPPFCWRRRNADRAAALPPLVLAATQLLESGCRPFVGLTLREDLPVERFLLPHGSPHRRLAEHGSEDIAAVPPE